MTILLTLNMGDITYNDVTYMDITYNRLHSYMTLLIIVNKKHLCNFTFISVIAKVVVSKSFGRKTIDRKTFSRRGDLSTKRGVDQSTVGRYSVGQMTQQM